VGGDIGTGNGKSKGKKRTAKGKLYIGRLKGCGEIRERRDGTVLLEEERENSSCWGCHKKKGGGGEKNGKTDPTRIWNECERKSKFGKKVMDEEWSAFRKRGQWVVVSHTFSARFEPKHIATTGSSSKK